MSRYGIQGRRDAPGRGGGEHLDCYESKRGRTNVTKTVGKGGVCSLVKKDLTIDWSKLLRRHTLDFVCSLSTARHNSNIIKRIKVTPKQRGGKEVTHSNVNRVLAGLRRLFNFAVSREYMEESPFPKTSKSGLFYPEPKGLRNFFTEEQMEKIVDASPERLKLLILTAYYTGLRESELLGLQWKQVDLKDGVIYLPSTKTLKDSTGRGQKVVMQRELIDLFQCLPKHSEWVFCQRDGRPYGKWHIYPSFKKLLKSLGIDNKQYSWKELRHTTASLIHRKGVPTLVIKDQLRHKNVKTTIDFYIGADTSYQREMIEKLVINSGKKVGNQDVFKNVQPASA